MKYCIGCIHLDYDPGKDAHSWSELTYEPAVPPGMACLKGHWEARLDLEFTQADLQAAMESAEDCEDFEERPAETEAPTE